MHTKEYRSFVERIRSARLSVGLKQTDVAKKLKKPQSYISKIESGEQRIDVIELKHLAKMYRLKIDYFLV